MLRIINLYFYCFRNWFIEIYSSYLSANIFVYLRYFHMKTSTPQLYLILSSNLFHCRPIAHNSCSSHVTRFIMRKWSRPMHCLTIVPYNQITFRPFMDIYKFFLSCMVHQISQQKSCFWNRETIY